jgi:hypothetical protein
MYGHTLTYNKCSESRVGVEWDGGRLERHAKDERFEATGMLEAVSGREETGMLEKCMALERDRKVKERLSKRQWMQSCSLAR